MMISHKLVWPSEAHKHAHREEAREVLREFLRDNPEREADDSDRRDSPIEHGWRR